MDRPDDIIVDATLFKSNSTQKRYIDDYLKDIMVNINIELKQAHRDGNYYIITEIPFIFDIPNMKNNTAQRIVWARTLEILKNKNFDVKIDSSQNKCRLKISWLDREQRSNIERENRILQECNEKF